jgi:outer membrane receptor for ferric coprogen and ferric-rhodotorulic acid
MEYPVKRTLALCIASCIYAQPSFAESISLEEADSDIGVVSSDGDTVTFEMLTVYGEPEDSNSATKLNLPIYETPQTVSVISEDQIEDYALNDVNSLLSYAPGVTVERVETGRTYYTARGFDIVNFQYDGVGVPFSYGLTQGVSDTALYEKVEVVKGATGLITGLANPSATINYVRKRPTWDKQASVKASAGSWGQNRLEADLSGALIEDTLSGRLVVARQEGDSYLDRYSEETSVFYGVLSGNITDSTRFTIGHSINDNHNEGNSSGALPLFYSDGTVTDYARSANTAQDWAYQDVKQIRTFAELEQDLNDLWQAKLILTRNVQEKEWDAFYISGQPDRATGDGLTAQASHYDAKDQERIADLFVTGQFSAWGQDHDLVVGANFADIKLTGRSIYSETWNYNSLDGIDWLSGNIPYPSISFYNPDTQRSNIQQTQKSFYASTRLHVTDDLAVLLGVRTIDIDQKGISYGSDQKASVNETVPYAGITYEVTPGTLLYGSYSKVFVPQTWVDSNLSPLGPVEGDSQEFGVKQELFDGAAILTLSRFKSEQSNFGEWVSRDTSSGLNIYEGVEYQSRGYELELSGELADGLNISAGYTQLRVKDEEGNKARRYIPTQQFKIATAYQVPGVDGLRIGGGINWQNEIYYADTKIQGSYALVDAFASYAATDNITLSLNVNNLTDEKYRESPQWGQANYGPGRNVWATLAWRY